MTMSDPIFKITRSDPGIDLIEILSTGRYLLSGCLAQDGYIAFHQQSQAGRRSSDVVPACLGESIRSLGVSAESELKRSAEPGTSPFLYGPEAQLFGDPGRASGQLQRDQKILCGRWRIRDAPPRPAVGGSVERKAFDH